MATVILPDSQQAIPIDDSLAADEKSLREALRPFVPSIATAVLTPTKGPNGELQIQIQKQAGQKGGAICP